MSAPGRAREGDGMVRLGWVRLGCWELELADRLCAHSFVITDWFCASVMCLICYIVPNNIFEIAIFDDKFDFTIACFRTYKLQASYFPNFN